MQSVMADVTYSAATWRTRRKICIIFDSGPLAQLRKKHDDSRNVTMTVTLLKQLLDMQFYMVT